jgi:sugar O-acyltransferase (sialic acid O-acetyltransferase NeuD family)
MANKKIVFYGGTGQAQVMLPIARQHGEVVAILDDKLTVAPPYMPHTNIPLFLGKDCLIDFLDSIGGAPTFVKESYHFVVTIGNPHGRIRISIAEQLFTLGLSPLSLIHDTAIISNSAYIGYGVQIHPGAIIMDGAHVEPYCIINTGAILEHESSLSMGCELGPGAVVCGETRIGRNSWICANATVRDHINIAEDTIVGMGAVVTKDIKDSGLVVAGVPAKVL